MFAGRRGGENINGLTTEMLREVGMLARCIQSISDVKYRDIKLQRGQFIYLTRICERPGISFGELSHLLKVDKATTTKAVQKLLDEQYVVRQRNETDKRIWHIYPSPKARKIYPDIIEEENRNIGICFTGFSAEEQETVIGLLRRMRENIEQEWKGFK
jgi:DNA-binding MarR family transcriptional regulator